MKKLSKRFLSLFLILAIFMSINVPAFASVTGNANVGDSEIVLGEKNVTIEPNAIIIDGVTVTKAEFIAALSSIAKMQNSPQTTRLYEYSQIVSDNAIATRSLVGVGVGISPVFATVAYTLFLVTILASMAYAAFVIPAGVFEGIDRTLNVVFTADTVIIDGIVMGLNWVSYELAQYVSKNVDTIGESTDWSSVIGQIASGFGNRKCIEAAEAIKEKLQENNLHGTIVTLTWEMANKNAKVWSYMLNIDVADNPIHVGVCYDGTIYCNMHPYGLPRNAWINDFHYPTDFTKKVVETPF